MSTLQYVGLFACLGGLAVVSSMAVRRENISALVNVLVSILLVLVPILVDVLAHRVYQVTLGLSPELPLWIAVAGLLHASGMLGVYDDVWWWDHLTHALSASLVAALAYAALLVTVDHVFFSAGSGLIWIVVVLLTLLAGVFWELLELLGRVLERQFGVPSVLDYYGRRDTIMDLCFDIVGALLVLFLDVRLFVPMVQVSPDATATTLVLALGGLTVGSLVVSLILAIGHTT
ncbi:MAG: hypothetical protein ACQET5_09385 [Halobacteriota archaeon]|uniref:hypothetical protein n=1 Tax=Natronomonas sp. TaxID=2184060 RepID=UPI003974F4E9